MNIKNLSKKELKTLLETHSRNDICEKFNVSSRTLSRVLKDKGLSKKGYGPKGFPMEKVDEIRSLYSQKKYTQKELATIYEISQSFVSKIVNKTSRRLHYDICLTSNSTIKVGYKYVN